MALPRTAACRAYVSRKGDGWSCPFRCRGKWHTFAVAMISEAETAAKSAQVECLLLWLKQRPIELLTGVEIVECGQFDGIATARDAAVHCLPRLTPAAFRDRARETHRGSLQASTLHTTEMHFRHRARILRGFPIRKRNLTVLQGDAIAGMDRPPLDIRTDILYE